MLELETNIKMLGAELSAATYTQMELIAEYDIRGGYVDYCLRSTAHWLNWQVGISLGAAREKVRVARALRDLPLISAAMQKGKISYSKVRAMTRVATVATEEMLLDLATYGTATHVEKTVRLLKGANREEEKKQANNDLESRYAKVYVDEDGMVVLKARLPAELGAVVKQALELEAGRIMDEVKNADRNNAELEMTYAQAQADALGRIAHAGIEAAAGDSKSADRHQVVVHVDQAVLEGGSGHCGEEKGINVPAETLRRLACDASLVEVVHDAETGEVCNVGRKSRKPSAALKRALQIRDGGCQFSGCTATKYVDAHHIAHWADGGETTLSNMILLCHHHHRAVHEGGFTVERNENGALFRRPDGAVLPSVPEMPLAIWPGELSKLGIEADLSEKPVWGGEIMDYGMAIDSLLHAQASQTG